MLFFIIFGIASFIAGVYLMTYLKETGEDKDGCAFILIGGLLGFIIYLLIVILMVVTSPTEASLANMLFNKI